MRSGFPDVVLKWAGLVVMATCLAVVGGTVWLVVRAPGDISNLGYQVGERIDVPADWLSGADHTLLIFVRSDCSASASMMQWFASIQDQTPAELRVLAVVQEATPEPEREKRFAQEAGFDANAIKTVELGGLNLRMVPTAVLVDGAGSVLTGMAGAVGRAERSAFLAELAEHVTGA